MESKFLGCLMGLAIGDALGMPISDMPGSTITSGAAPIVGYQSRPSDSEDDIPAGEITDETELVLCMIESMTTNNGHIDTENINARLIFLAQGASRRWMPEDIREGILVASDHEGVVPTETTQKPNLAVAVRGVPIGLLHGVGAFDRDAIVEDARLATRLTHAGVLHEQLVLDVAIGIAALLRGEDIKAIALTAELSEISALRQTIADLLNAASGKRSFDDVVLSAVNGHQPADSAGAIAGAFSGARYGAGGISQGLIDGLGARVYLTLAAPWFYRTVVRRAGMLIDLRRT